MQITRLNFKECLPFIKSTIQSSHFLSIDTQMSGIKTQNITSPSIVDSMQRRYEKNVQSIKKFIPLQFGLTAFKIIPQQNKIIAYPFNFYIFPFTQSNEIMKFSFHTGTMTFLTKNNFDFNKLFYEGIPYLSLQKLNNYKKTQRTQEIKRQLKRLKLSQSPDQKAFIKTYMPLIEEWQKKDQSHIQIDIKHIKYQVYNSFKDSIEEKYFNHELKFKFDQQQIYRRSKMIIEKVKNKQKQNLNEEKGSFVPQQQMLFNQIIDQIAKMKKPLITHNGLLDIMHIYYSFYGSFPATWKYFRTQIHTFFPNIYDNKYLFNNSPTLFHLVNKITSLDICYSTLRSIEQKAKDINGNQLKIKNQFKIQIDPQFNLYSFDNVQCHEAGFDSLMTGYAFLKGLNLLNYSIEKLTQKDILYKQLQVTRNRIPQGSLKIPFNFESTEDDIYVEDGNQLFLFKSVYNKLITDSEVITQYFLEKYGAVNFIVSFQSLSDFYITFIKKEDQDKFVAKLQAMALASGGVSFQIINSCEYIVYSQKKHQQFVKNWINNQSDLKI